jgi:predicted ATPase
VRIEKRLPEPCIHSELIWAGWGIVVAGRGDIDAGLTLLRSEIDRAGDARLLPRFLFPLGELAACLGEPNEIEKGFATVDAAGTLHGKQGHRYVPELLRIMGELLLKKTRHRSSSSAEQRFSEGLRLAKQQGALFWELRNALGLARLWTT